ncbi:MAG: T9SS type A sorting domain-containing protein [Bacteroidota bacterium]
MFKQTKLIAATLVASMYVSLSYSQVTQVTENETGISRRLQQEIDMTKDPALGYVPKDRLVNAYTVRREKINKRTTALLSATAFTWTERGPYIDAVGPSNGNTRPGNGKTSGRVRAIWEDITDATGNTFWVGGIDGGLWKTNNISANPATWTPINDFFGNLAIASICQDPSNPNIMYFGTGEKATNADAVRGAGLWVSYDHGITWAVMANTANFWNVSKIICDANGNLYVGCNSRSNTSGLQRFTKSTGTWTNITPTGLNPRVPDIELSSTGRLHIACGYFDTPVANTGYRFTDNPAAVTSGTWTSPSTSLPHFINIDLASVGATLYALPANTSYEVGTIYKSTNGGVNWSATAVTPTALTNGQAWYNMAVGIDPNNANNVIAGGLDCYRSSNGGSSWAKISNWVGTTGQYVHADQQNMLWNKNNRVIVASDGGIHLSNDGGTTFTDRNQGLRIKQFYSIAIHPTTTNYFLAGAQDNGTHQLNGAGLSSSVEVTGGDGAFVHIDQNQPQYQWGSYVYNQYRRSTNSGGSWGSVNISASAGRFINPTDYDDVSNIMYCSGATGAFYRWSTAQTGSTASSVSLSGLTGTASAIKVSPYTSNLVFFAGGGSGLTPSLIKATNANATITAASLLRTGMPGTSTNISSIEVGTSDQNLIITYSNYGISNVWVTSDGGATWSAIDGNLPDMPVRWAMFYPGSNTKAIIATETGVWQTDVISGGTTVWDPEPTFPNVRVDMLQYRVSDGLLAAATHGRGIFTTIVGASPATCGTVAGLAASNISTTTAMLNWSALNGAITYDVDYKLTTSATWTNAATATTNLSVALSGLTLNTLYDYRVRANCNGISGTYASAQFTTSATATCGNVSGLAATGVSTNSATLGWSSLNGAINYDLEYKLSTEANWINAATATTNLSVAISSLTASSLYDYRVRANCIDATGIYTNAQFTTNAVVTCPGIYDVSTNGSAAGAATIQLNNTALGTIGSNTDVDYYKFTISTAGTATITLTTLPANYDLTLYSSNGTSQLALSKNNGTNNETISGTLSAGTYYLKVSGKTGAFNATTCYTLNVQTGTATTLELPVSNPLLQVKMYPNPVSHKLSIYVIADNTKKNLVMYDVTGKQVYTQQLNDMFTNLDLSKLHNGVYFVRIKSADGKVLHSEKVIKN